MFVPQAAIKEEDHPEKDQPSGTPIHSFFFFNFWGIYLY